VPLGLPVGRNPPAHRATGRGNPLTYRKRYHDRHPESSNLLCCSLNGIRLESANLLGRSQHEMVVHTPGRAGKKQDGTKIPPCLFSLTVSKHVRHISSPLITFNSAPAGRSPTRAVFEASYVSVGGSIVSSMIRSSATLGSATPCISSPTSIPFTT
jgi:hypothetical protein